VVGVTPLQQAVAALDAAYATRDAAIARVTAEEIARHSALISRRTDEYRAARIAADAAVNK
jgi:hypothetical protein